ncbi:unnamed protein product [Somion occarium]|uniref:EF-hand domain-containing protein n=1 Tax=Somion occarium TaxID=3059160 RepID=A0ABP1CMK7_9APHY
MIKVYFLDDDHLRGTHSQIIFALSPISQPRHPSTLLAWRVFDIQNDPVCSFECSEDLAVCTVTSQSECLQAKEQRVVPLGYSTKLLRSAGGFAWSNSERLLKDSPFSIAAWNASEIPQDIAVCTVTDEVQSADEDSLILPFVVFTTISPNGHLSMKGKLRLQAFFGSGVLRKQLDTMTKRNKIVQILDEQGKPWEISIDRTTQHGIYAFRKDKAGHRYLCPAGSEANFYSQSLLANQNNRRNSAIHPTLWSEEATLYPGPAPRAVPPTYQQQLSTDKVNASRSLPQKQSRSFGSSLIRGFKNAAGDRLKDLNRFMKDLTGISFFGSSEPAGHSIKSGVNHAHATAMTHGDTQLVQWFEATDVDHSGEITIHELYRAFLKDDSTFEIDTVRMLMTLFDKDTNGTLSFGEAIALWDYIKTWQDEFQRFDRDHNGKIDRTELQAALDTFGYHLSPQLLARLSARHGLQNGLSFSRFMRICAQIKEHTERFQMLDEDGKGQVSGMTYDQFMYAQPDM